MNSNCTPIKAKLPLIFISIFVIWIAGPLVGNDKKLLPDPDFEDLQYGMHERNVLDVWFAESSGKTPMAIYIHGGGFVNGSKKSLSPYWLNELLKSGISVAAINYRFLKDAPLPAAHNDAARAVQFLRSNAYEWNLDKDKFAAFGSSAGAQLSMWLAFTDDMANPNSKDPVERESTRLSCVVANGGQTSMDFDIWREWVPEFIEYRTTREDFYGILSEEAYLKTIRALSAIDIVSADDPPIFMSYGMRPDDPIPANPRKAQGWKVHHVSFGVHLQRKMEKLGVEAHLKYPDSTTKYKDRIEFLKDKLIINSL